MVILAYDITGIQLLKRRNVNCNIFFHRSTTIPCFEMLFKELRESQLDYLDIALYMYGIIVAQWYLPSCFNATKYW